MYTKHVEALAPWLRRQVDEVNPQECEELLACNTCDALEEHGEQQIHAPVMP